MDLVGVADGTRSAWPDNGCRRNNLNDNKPYRLARMTYPDTFMGLYDPDSVASSSAVSIREPHKFVFESLKSFVSAEDLILKSRQHRVTSTGAVLVPNGRTESRIGAQKICVATMFITGGHLTNSLEDHLRLGLLSANA